MARRNARRGPKMGQDLDKGTSHSGGLGPAYARRAATPAPLFVLRSPRDKARASEPWEC